MVSDSDDFVYDNVVPGDEWKYDGLEYITKTGFNAVLKHLLYKVLYSPHAGKEYRSIVESLKPDHHGYHAWLKKCDNACIDAYINADDVFYSALKNKHCDRQTQIITGFYSGLSKALNLGTWPKEYILVAYEAQDAEDKNKKKEADDGA